MKRITIKDLAGLLNLSASTISRALSDHPDISDKTKQRVKEVAKSMHYIPNFTAKNLRTRQSGLIALILPELPMFFTQSLITAANEVVHNNGYNLVMLQTNNTFEKEKEIIEYCYTMGVDGVMLSLTEKSDNLNHLQILKRAQIPVVLLDRILVNNDFPYITIDGVKTAFTAIDHLIKKGHRNIVGFFGNLSLDMTRKRIAGFKKALKNNGIPYNPQQIICFDTPEEMDAAFPQIVKLMPETTAFFTMSDTLMVNAYHLIKKYKYQIPEDFALISISNGKAPNFLYPNVSHVLHSGYDVGQKACEVLLELINGHSKPDLKQVITTELVVAESV